MKKVFTATLVLASTMAFAQSAKVVSAYNYNRKGELAQAWTTIEEAIKDPGTGVEPKTWKYRFDILFSIYNVQMDPKGNLEYKNLVPMDKIGEEMKSTYQKVKELDPKNKFVSEINDQINGFYTIYRNNAAEAFNGATTLTGFKDTVTTVGSNNTAVLKQKATKLKAGNAEALKCLEGTSESVNDCLDKAIKQKFMIGTQMFASSYNLKELIGETDSASVFYAGVCAEYAGLTEVAVKLYRETIRIKYNGADVVSLAAKLERDLGHKEEAINIIKEGRKSYPEDLNLLIEELNVYLVANDFAAAERLLKEATEKSPNNETMFYALGTTYDNLANPKADGKTLPKPANYTELVAKAQAAYKKTLEIKPDFFDALYNYGALLFNEGAELNNKANDLDYRTKQKQIDELNKQAEAKFKEAMPLFEKALSLKGDDLDVLLSLKQVYQRLEMTDKFTEVNNKIKSLSK